MQNAELLNAASSQGQGCCLLNGFIDYWRGGGGSSVLFRITANQTRVLLSVCFARAVARVIRGSSRCTMLVTWVSVFHLDCYCG